MKTLISLFTKNWGLKLLALVLAIVVYYSMKDTAVNSGDSSNIFLKGPNNGR